MGDQPTLWGIGSPLWPLTTSYQGGSEPRRMSACGLPGYWRIICSRLTQDHLGLKHESSNRDASSMDNPINV